MPDKKSDIANRIGADIRAGVYPPGSHLPTSEELINRYGSSRVTMTRALEILERQNLVRRQPSPFQAVVLDWRQAVQIRARRVLHDPEDYGYNFDALSARLWPVGPVDIAWMHLDVNAAALLGVEPGADALMRRRAMGTPERCEQLSTRLVLADVAREAGLEEEMPVGAPLDRVEACFGKLEFVDVCQARKATLEEARTLETAIDGPLLVVTTVASAGGRPLLLTEYVVDGVRWAMQYPLIRAGATAGQ